MHARRTRDRIKEIKCFQAESAHLPVAAAYTISSDNAGRVPGVTKTDRGFMFTGRERGACNACTYDPPTHHLRACIYSVYRPLVYVSVHCYVHLQDAMLLLPIGRSHS